MRSKRPPFRREGSTDVDARPNIVLVHGAWADAMVSHPDEVAQFIRTAADGVRRADD
jgi:hypothetical protein